MGKPGSIDGKQDMSQALCKKYIDLHQGWKTFCKKITPTHNKLCSTALLNDTKHHLGLSQHITPERIDVEQTMEERELYLMEEYLRGGGKGYISEHKDHGWVQIRFENFNSLGIFGRGWKLDQLNTYIRLLHIDVIAGCETQTDWSYLPRK